MITSRTEEEKLLSTAPAETLIPLDQIQSAQKDMNQKIENLHKLQNDIMQKLASLSELEEREREKLEARLKLMEQQEKEVVIQREIKIAKYPYSVPLVIQFSAIL